MELEAMHFARRDGHDSSGHHGTASMLYKTERDIVPDEVHVVTTSSGADCIRETLLDPSCGRWQDFVSALGADKTISFNAANVHVIRTADGRKLDDIRTPEDNTWAADCITECVRSFCARDDVRLLVSMGEGEKAWGFARLICVVALWASIPRTLSCTGFATI